MFKTDEVEFATPAKRSDMHDVKQRRRTKLAERFEDQLEASGKEQRMMREALGLSRAELAEIFGVCEDSIYKYESKPCGAQRALALAHLARRPEIISSQEETQ